MSNNEYGYFQVVLKSTDTGATSLGQTADYKINLQGQYKLTLVYMDFNSLEATPPLRLINLYSPQLTQFYGNVRNITVMYPRLVASQNAEHLGIFEYCFYVNLNSQLSLQWREEDGSPMTDFDISTITFKYEKM